MKFVLNACYGGFGLSDFALETLGIEDEYDLKRNDPKLVELVETYGSEKVSGCCAELVVEEIPDTATDWTIDEYDGSETLIYVVDGKLHYA
jgi:hypothetical protein